ncbi:Mov34/MPN/PAD-1 family protein [Sphingomonas phyllosphaerae]|uniref:Mov34/MPN/PAD-1 family protein n=1 Tax=Sphingomonas phyllosphaerae TaxID=257003 RepID=UPI000490E610|nr:M67 family metallopeptidase [Sphingomonas phyllosphaerae]
MMVRITIAHRNELIALAAADPDEICGLLLGAGDQIMRLVPCRNVAGDRAVRFEIDPGALIAAHRVARNGGAQVIGHYHSHPSGVARPSPRDAADSAPDGSIWLIVAGEAVTAWRAVADGGVHGRFDPLVLDVSGCADSGDSPQGRNAIPPR